MHGRDESPLVDVTLHTSFDVRLGRQLKLAAVLGSRSSPRGFGRPAKIVRWDQPGQRRAPVGAAGVPTPLVLGRGQVGEEGEFDSDPLEGRQEDAPGVGRGSRRAISRLHRQQQERWTDSGVAGGQQRGSGDRQELWREHDQEIRQPDEEEAIIGALFRSLICPGGTPMARLHPGAALAPVTSCGRDPICLSHIH